MTKSTHQQIVGEHLVATIVEKNYYTNTLNKIFVPKMKNKTLYNLTLDYGIPEVSFAMELDKESLKGLADFIKEFVENN